MRWPRSPSGPFGKLPASRYGPAAFRLPLPATGGNHRGNKDGEEGSLSEEDRERRMTFVGNRMCQQPDRDPLAAKSNSPEKRHRNDSRSRNRPNPSRDCAHALHPPLPALAGHQQCMPLSASLRSLTDPAASPAATRCSSGDPPSARSFARLSGSHRVSPRRCSGRRSAGCDRRAETSWTAPAP